ncbi:MAG: M20/M25/M40 family metallo-hydrolase [Vicinamibacterales bacterium]
MSTRFLATFLLGTTMFVASLFAVPQAQTAASLVSERVDLDAIGRIKTEGLQRSQVMELVWNLTDVHGPRLTNSPEIRAAATWARERLSSWGLSGVAEEKWGPFGRGWTNEQFAAQVVAPTVSPLIAYPRAWTPGTSGPVTADVVLAVVNNDQDMEKFRGKLAGKIVLIFDAVDVPLPDAARGLRFTDEELRELQSEPVRGGGARGRGNAAAGPPPDPNIRLKRMTFYQSEGALAALIPGNGRGDRGVVMTGAYELTRQPNSPAVVPQVYVATEQYNRLVRLVERNVAVKVSIDMRNRFTEDTLDAFNIVAEIRGTDKADEVVMLGAHFDSETAGTGATDNAAGSAAMMEAMRILKATGLRMRRTVRLALWTGEEQGLLGSAAYVAEHFADVDTMQLKPAHARLSVYFNMDNGSGAIRGVYTQGNEAVRPVFSAWMEPLRSLGMTTLAIRGVGGTDHASFDRVGLPGFQFVQDRLEYNALSHHTNMDVFERVQAEDMMKNSVIIASFAYQAANREELLPRKVLPQPRNARRGGP